MAYFLKHLTEETMALKKLLIPPEFISNCGRANLTNPVVLEPTVGDPPQVEVELYEDARGFWLRNGWQEFADRNSLTHGHYVLFEYKSFSRFKLVMFGANGVDVMCPASSFHNVGSNRNLEFREAEQDEEARGSPVAGSGGGQPARPRFAENAKQKAFMATRKGRTADGGQSGKRNQFGKDKAETSRIPAKAEHVEVMMGRAHGSCPLSSTNEVKANGDLDVDWAASLVVGQHSVMTTL
ncbi:unnamed protein product [Linum tenue]|uniref:TF-B3 domain-containing protein n=1 Tax=Linum tenue TaxID=586396 RepID=A0AAV0RAH3_9ROSI|nr:unnamed protein product [Linum tenue]